MASYELNLIVKRLSRPALVDCLKRVGEQVLDAEGAVLRKIEFLGHKKLPYTIRNRHQKHVGSRFKEGSYFIFHLECAPPESKRLLSDLLLDYDIISAIVMPRWPKLPADYVCTLHEELLPPSKRPSVQAMLKEGARPTQKPEVNVGTHIDDGDFKQILP